MSAPLLQAQIDIDAPPARVWSLISDFRRMPEWSPQCRLMKPLGAVKPGTRTFKLKDGRTITGKVLLDDPVYYTVEVPGGRQEIVIKEDIAQGS